MADHAKLLLVISDPDADLRRASDGAVPGTNFA
jgi:hypothetical protein